MPDQQLGQAVLVSARVSMVAWCWARCCAAARSRAMRYATSGRAGGPVMRNRIPLASMGLRLLGGVESVHGAHLAAPSGAEHVIKSASGCFEAAVGVAQGHGNECWCVPVDVAVGALGVLFGLEGCYAGQGGGQHGVEVFALGGFGLSAGLGGAVAAL